MKDNKGFSLVELIVVIAIMAILATVAVVSYSVYIERAQDAADQKYLADVVYRAELVAMENQIQLEQVVVAPVVDGPEDIVLIVKDSVTGELTTKVADEIFESVGGYAFGENYNNGTFDPDATPITPPTAGEGQPTHDDHEMNVVDSREPTCTTVGYIHRECECGKTEVETLAMIDHDYQLVAEKDEFTYYVCDMCGKIIIKSTNGTPIVPIG